MNNMKPADMWNQRYAAEDYAYGTEPNAFLKSVLDELKPSGTALFPAEGEGRNAVYAAKCGLHVSAFDLSSEGQKKALKLAELEGVEIEYQVGDFHTLDLVNRTYDVIVLIYAHFPPLLLSTFHQTFAELLNPGGFIILEGFSKGNLPYREANPGIGGPDQVDFLFDTDSIANDFKELQIVKLEDIEVELNEGLYHKGVGRVVRYIGRKTN